MTDLSQTTQRIAAAQAGDQQVFGDLIEPHRAELLVHCYRLLGSWQDAEDMVQETFLRAWNHLDSFSGGVYFRAWLYKIATNICLDALDKRSRRLLAPANFPVSNPYVPLASAIREPVWLEPFADDQLPQGTLNPEARYSLRESISLAFLAALQLLPPQQRVILILCDVLDWRAREAAQLLDLTVSAVNSALHRARSTMNRSFHPRETVVDDQIRDVLKRYVEAWESGDVDTLIALLKDNVILTMPPSPAWFSGREAVRVHAASICLRGIRDQWRLLPTRANNQLAFACYRRDERDGGFHAHALQLIQLEGEQITEIQMFLQPHCFPRFGFPLVLA